MSKLPSSRQVQQVLAAAGFVCVRQKGSHQRWSHDDGRRCTVVDAKKEVPLGTIRSIARQCQLPFSDFLNL